MTILTIKFLLALKMEADRAVSERYHVLELIGEGSFGRVYKGRKKLSKQVMANFKTSRSP